MKKSTGDKRGGTDDNQDPVFAFHAATLTGVPGRVRTVSPCGARRNEERPLARTAFQLQLMGSADLRVRDQPKRSASSVIRTWPSSVIV
jgi:hypothetical protein